MRDSSNGLLREKPVANQQTFNSKKHAFCTKNNHLRCRLPAGSAPSVAAFLKIGLPSGAAGGGVFVCRPPIRVALLRVSRGSGWFGAGGLCRCQGRSYGFAIRLGWRGWFVVGGYVGPQVVYRSPVFCRETGQMLSSVRHCLSFYLLSGVWSVDTPVTISS